MPRTVFIVSFVVLLCVILVIVNRDFKVIDESSLFIKPLPVQETEYSIICRKEDKILSERLPQSLPVQETKNHRIISWLAAILTRKNEILPQSVIDRVKMFVFFLGHPRSGHSIIGSLMDAHPHMVIGSEYDVFTKISEGIIPPTKQFIFNALWDNTNQILIGMGLRATGNKGYTLSINGLYQGRYVDHIDVIGDKKGGSTAGMLMKYPDEWLRIYNNLLALNISIKIIYVIRNPYDNIATITLYSSIRSVEVIKQIKQSNKTHIINNTQMINRINHYFLKHEAIVNAQKKYNLSIIEIHNEDLISDPTTTLMKLCNSLGVICCPKYLEICSKKIFKNESRTRHSIKWTDEQLMLIQQNIEKHSSFNGYSYYSP